MHNPYPRARPVRSVRTILESTVPIHQPYLPTAQQNSRQASATLRACFINGYHNDWVCSSSNPRFLAPTDRGLPFDHDRYAILDHQLLLRYDWGKGTSRLAICRPEFYDRCRSLARKDGFPVKSGSSLPRVSRASVRPYWTGEEVGDSNGSPKVEEVEGWCKTTQRMPNGGRGCGR
ncbi:hypothetical protein BKA81DRAFT_53404 [Phyllosticta paracitricarpa]